MTFLLKFLKSSATGKEKTMSNSSLVNYTRLSPNHSGKRNHVIDTITIHCMAGNCSVETCGNIFADEDRQTSSNYGVGSDGRIALYVDEANRSWCTSSASNDHRAVTIEVANDAGKPDWHVSNAALASLINLVTDICKRNGIKKLLWQGDKSLIGQVDKQNMTVHRWFAAKACPGDYLYNLHPTIAAEVNARLGAGSNTGSTGTATSYRVKVTADVLNVRKGPGTGYAITAQIKDQGVYTIVEENSGWGRLKSGAGWISLAYTSKI